MTRKTLTAALAAALTAIVPAAARAGDPSVPTRIVDVFNQRYGAHPGYRSNHAKGIVVEGSFTGSPGAASLTRSPIFAGAKLPATVRFSDASGLPDLPDASPLANPHGMAIKLHLPGGVESDIVVNALRFFPVATPEEFLELNLAAAAAVPPGAKMSPQLEAFLASHPNVARANATLGIPASFADEEYYGIDAFLFTNQAGHQQAFRYIIAPEKVVHLTSEDAANQPPNYLMDELPVRLSKDPVKFHIKAQLAAAGDSTRDPTQSWPADRKIVDLGVLTIERTVADSAAAQKKLLFLPGRLTDGIEPSDDPLIAARDAAYGVSFGRRSANQSGSNPK